MLEQPVLTVIIPALNSVETIGEQLSALELQLSALNFQVIVVDNGSSDGTVELVNSYCRRRSEFTLVVADSVQGSGYARNVGASLARSDKLAFCDADDIVGDQWATAMSRALETFDFVTGPIELDRLNPEWIIAARGRWLAKPSEPSHFAPGVPFASACNMGVTKYAFQQVGGFDERFVIGQDVELSLRMWSCRIVLNWVDDALIHYRYRPSLRALWRQGRRYGAARVALSSRLGELGGPVLPNGGIQLKNTLWLGRNLDLLLSSHRGRWLWVCANLLGQMDGLAKRILGPRDVTASTS